MKTSYGYLPHPGGNSLDPYIFQGDRPSCAVQSQLLLLRDFGQMYTPEALIDFARQQGWYSPEGGTPMGCVGNILQACGIPVTRREGCNIYDIVAELRAGHRVIVGVDANELWVNDEQNLLKKFWQETQNRVKDAADSAAGIPGANHALVVAGVQVDPAAPGNVSVIVTDPGNGNFCRTYDLRTFQDAFNDSRCFMVSTDVPAPYQYNPVTHMMEPSGYTTHYSASTAATPEGLVNTFQLPDDYFETYADYEPHYAPEHLPEAPEDMKATEGMKPTEDMEDMDDPDSMWATGEHEDYVADTCCYDDATTCYDDDF